MNNPPEKEYFPVKKFADRAGVSSQYVYKLLNNKLKPYVIDKDGKKQISTEALPMFANGEEDDSIDEQQIVENQLTVYKQTIEILQTQLNTQNELMKTQLTEKDRQLSEKDKQLAEKDKQLEKADARLKEAHELNKGNLLLLNQYQDKLLTTPKTETETYVTQEETKEQKAEEPLPDKPPVKVGFGERIKGIFHKK